MKHYQNALKLHSQGPSYYEEAAAAYETLFGSEIFKYPESNTNIEQNGLHDDVDEDDDFFEGNDQAATVLPTPGANETPSTLPQILYLAHKNYGQFHLDRLRAKLLRSALKPEEIRSAVLTSLRFLIEATDKDDTDLQLWRLIAKLCDFLGSKRLARYCLEAALETDDGNYDPWPEPQGLDESLAAEQLQHLLADLGDNVAESEIKLLPGRRNGLIQSLKKVVDPCPYLPTPPTSPEARSLAVIVGKQAEKEDIIVPKRTWESLGKSILLQITNIAQGLVEPDFGTAYRVVLPSAAAIRPEVPVSVRGGGSVSSASKTPKVVNASLTARLPRKEEVDQFQTPHNASVPEESVSASEQEPKLQTGGNKITELEEFGIESNSVDTFEIAREQTIHQEKPLTEAEIGKDAQVPESPRTMSLPTRKRSSEVAGLLEPIDTGRSKSKRIKARVSTVDPSNDEVANQYEQQLQEFVQADSALFESAGIILSRLGANRLGALDTLRASIAHADQSPVDPSDIAAQDFRQTLHTWNLEKSNILLRKSKGGDEFDGANGARNFTAFLENSKRGAHKPASVIDTIGDTGMDDFVDRINRSWTFLDPLALAWIERMLSPIFEDSITAGHAESMYESQRWPEPLKKIVVQMLVQRDEYIYPTLRNRLDTLDAQILTGQHQSHPKELKKQMNLLIPLVQHIFEIHLDIYERITNPSSEVDLEIRTMQLDRLGRWNVLAASAMNMRPQTPANVGFDQIDLRFLWASVLYVNLTDPSVREHVILSFEDLKRILRIAGQPVIRLVNNAAMPEVSIEAAEREISSLTTMDFFMGIFISDTSKPLTIIESLEPMLEQLAGNTETDGQQAVGSMEELDQAPSASGANASTEHEHYIDPRMDSMVQYLRKASLPLRLFLWQKLSSAYEAIDYHPRVLSCNFRRIELIVNYLGSQDYHTVAKEMRRLELLGWLRDLDALISSSLLSATNEANAFEFIDNDQLRSIMSTMSALQRILHVYMLWKDSVHVGQTPTFQPPRGPALNGYAASMNKFEHLQIKSWMLQYMLLQEVQVQEPEVFEIPGQYFLEHLNLLHDSLGLREMCGLQSKQFLRLIRSEMLKHRSNSGNYTAILKDGTSNWDRDFAQIIFDLHGLKTLPSWWGLRSHGCALEMLDRSSGLQLMDFVIIHANRMSIKDLAKSELRGAIEKIQAAIKPPTPLIDTSTAFNKRSITAYLKRPVNPLDLYRSFRGLVDISSTDIDNENAAIAAKGWYYLLGHLSLAKFRAQNRTIPGALDDLDNATIYFRQDLELGMEKWETWYRLAQTFDVKIEENTKWNAIKLNTAMDELKTVQRNAIHCYTMALSTASRANATLEDVGKMPELYYDFALRIYASSREPYSMGAFGLEDFDRHYNNQTAGMYKNRPFKGLQLYAAWNFAKVLLQRSVAHKAQAWASWYLLGKCLWKMHNCDDRVRGNSRYIDHSEVLEAFERAVETAPERRDKDPIFEPHYKLLSVVHKLVKKKRLAVQDACIHLRITPYARKVAPPDDHNRWNQYILEILKVLRAADKQNWHHRMAARAAHIAYDDSPEDVNAAKAAKEELTQQIFTKTMNIQVWRPEHERAGRHFVYTTRYATFFLRLLIQIGDTVNLEALAKKIRKKDRDFIGHTELWDSICQNQLNLLRSKGDIAYCHFDLMFKNTPLEVFMLNADRLDEWVHQPEFNSHLIDLIRDTIELKKLNLGLTKVSPIEELIRDIYATLYEQILPEIIAKSTDEENRLRMRVDHVLMGPETSFTDTPPPDQLESAGDVPTTRTRAVGIITKKELYKRAEALVARSNSANAATNVTKPAELEPAPQPEAGPSIGLSPPPIPQEGAKDDASSVPGSVHDSADDESELSEVEFVDAPEEAIEEAPTRSRAATPVANNWALDQYQDFYAAQGDGDEADEAGDQEDGNEEEVEEDDVAESDSIEILGDNGDGQDGMDVVMEDGDGVV